MDSEAIGRVRRRVLGFARTLTLSDRATEPEDVVQQAWVRALPKLAPDLPEEEWGRYLNHAVVNIVRDQGRWYTRGGWRSPLPLVEWMPDSSDVEGEVGARIGLAAVAADTRRGALAATLIACGYRYEDAAAILGVPPGTVSTTVRRWRRGHVAA